MKLCLGTVQFGMDYGISQAGQPAVADAIDILECAVNNGVLALDTAAAYGTAEDVIGVFLKQNSGYRSKIELISKLPSVILDNKPKQLHSQIIHESLLRSLERLGVDYLDAYLFHNPQHIYDDNLINIMMNFKNEGLVKQIGASVYTPDEAKKGIENKLDILQIPYSIFDQRMNEQNVLNMAQCNGVNLHTRSVFTQGLMLMEDTDIPPHLEAARKIVRDYKEFCAKNEVTRVELAIAFISRQKSITHLVFGVDSKEHLLEIIESNKKPIPDKILNDAEIQFAKLDEDIIMPNRWNKSR